MRVCLEALGLRGLRHQPSQEIRLAGGLNFHTLWLALLYLIRSSFRVLRTRHCQTPTRAVAYVF